MIIRSNKGAALPTTIIIIAVLMIFSSILLNMYQAEGKSVYRQEQKEEAYYIARSGVESLGAVFVNGAHDDANVDFLNRVEAMAIDELIELDPHTIHDGTVALSIRKISEPTDDTAEYLIEGIGEVNGINEKVQFTLRYEEPTMNNIFNNAIYSFEDLDINSFSTIDNGTIGSGGTITYTNASDIVQPEFIDSDGTVYGVDDNDHIAENFIDYYVVSPKPTVTESDLPSGLPNVGSISIGNGVTETIDTEEEYNEIEVKNGGTLHFNPGPDETDILDVIVDDIEVKGDITFESGLGTVRLYVRNTAVFQTSNSMDQDAGRFQVIGLEGSHFEVVGNAIFKGYIYAPGGTVNINTMDNNGVTGGIEGGVVANSVTVGGQSTIIYVLPTSDVPPFDGELHLYKPLYWSDDQ